MGTRSGVHLPDRRPDSGPELDLLRSGGPGPGWSWAAWTVPVPGLHNARNAAVATVAALAAGVPVRGRGPGPVPVRRGGPPVRVPGGCRRGDLRGRLRPPPDRGARRAGPRRATATGAGSWRCSSPTATAGPSSWPPSSARPSAMPTWWWSPMSTPPARPPCPGVSGQLVADAVHRPGLGSRWSTWPARPTCAARSRTSSSPGTSACTLGAGDLTTLPDELLSDPSW